MAHAFLSTEEVMAMVNPQPTSKPIPLISIDRLPEEYRDMIGDEIYAAVKAKLTAIKEQLPDKLPIANSSTIAIMSGTGGYNTAIDQVTAIIDKELK